MQYSTKYREGWICVNYRDPEIFNMYKSIKEDVDRMSEDELIITIDRCDEMLGMKIPERYYYDACAYIYFIRERLKFEFKVGATQ